MRQMDLGEGAHGVGRGARARGLDRVGPGQAGLG
jgi:hypothetical protein